MEINEEDYLAHYGILRRSGRYPWGSGGPEKASNKGFIEMVDALSKEGLSQTEIARGLGISTGQLRAAKSIAKNEIKQANITQAQLLRDKGMGYVAIGEKMGLPESSVRALLAPGVKDKTDILTSTSDMLKSQVEKKEYLDVGAGVEHHLVGVSKGMLSNAVAVLKEQGYEVHELNIPQLTSKNQFTKAKILTKPGVTRKEVWENRDKVKQITDFSDDGGRSYLGIHPPLAISPKRVGVNYKEDGGAEADGVIYVRPGVKDVSLGASRYAQVRIMVGPGHYLKGMAMYKDDLPEGVDLLFNTNKSKNDVKNKLDALKPVQRNPDGTVDMDNPFGAVIKAGGQQVVRNKNGDQKVTSAMNIVNEEGDWGRWSKNLSSQMLSKQSPTLAKTQLGMTYEARQREYDRISKLTNPTVRKKLLETFGDEADSAAVHLKAAALNARQASHVILPITNMKPNEIFAPNYRDGERVVLIRHPHAGTFEIPELTVNNQQRTAKKLLAGAKDAVGIHPSVAERLSGADFDGDSVIVIPNGGSKRIKTTSALDGLKDFDPRTTYKAYPGMKPMTPKVKQQQMGDVSNLITDMTIMKASTSEIARAVRHSMVVIDAEKHNLNYKLSEEQNGIRQLKQKYQGGGNRGASTLISRANSEARVPDRKERSMAKGGPIDRDTGKRVYEETGKGYISPRTGEFVLNTNKVAKLALTDDAHSLSSGTPMEKVYADHSNSLKALANRARKEAVNTPPLKRSPSAAKTYKTQVDSLSAKLVIAQRNAPLERQAQILANAIVKLKQDADPNMEEATLKKVKSQALAEARTRTGAKKTKVVIEQDEWDAIQAGAVSNSKLESILANADLDVVRELATPRQPRLMTNAKTARAKAMLASGYTRAQIADQLGVSLTTLDIATTD